MLDPDEILAKAVNLKEGEKLIIKFRSLPEMNAFRMRLTRKKQKMPSVLAGNLRIESNKTQITLFCETAPEVVFVSSDGDEKPFVFDREVEVIAAMMKEDGRSEEEIDEMRRTFGA